MVLPVVGELVVIDYKERESLKLLVMAVDPEQGLWTCLSSDTDELCLVVFDENWNYHFPTPQRFKHGWET